LKTICLTKKFTARNTRGKLYEPHGSGGGDLLSLKRPKGLREARSLRLSVGSSRKGRGGWGRASRQEFREMLGKKGDILGRDTREKRFTS